MGSRRGLRHSIRMHGAALGVGLYLVVLWVRCFDAVLIWIHDHT